MFFQFSLSPLSFSILLYLVDRDVVSDITGLYWLIHDLTLEPGLPLLVLFHEAISDLILCFAARFTIGAPEKARELHFSLLAVA